jgi:hypothetical protein
LLHTAIAAALFLLLQTSPGDGRQSPTARIEGVVTQTGSGEPIANARLTLTHESGPGTSAAVPAVTTDRSGKFLFQNLDAGTYKLAVKSNGYTDRYLREDHGQRVNGPIALVAGQALRDVVIRLTAAGNVSGLIRGPSGRPFPGISIELVRRGYSEDGIPEFVTLGSARTDDRGEYRIFWVPPGRYYVRAPGAGLPHLTSYRANYGVFVEHGDNEVLPQNATTFFPGVTDIDQAAVIDIPPAGEVTGIDFTVGPLQLFHVRGYVVDSRTGLPPAQATVMIAGSGIGFQAAYKAADGTFNAGSVIAGVHFLTATDRPMKGMADFHFENLSGSPGAAASATVAVYSDINDVQLTLTMLPPIAGRVRVDGSLPPGVTLDRLRVMFRPSDLEASEPPISIRQASVPVTADGTFGLNAVSDEQFRVIMPALPHGLYLKQATLDGKDALNHFSPFRDGPLDIVVSSKGGQVEGVVWDNRHQPTGGVQAVLIPDEGRDRPELFKTATTDRNGRFTISDVAPREYKLFAWEDLDLPGYFDPEFLKRFEQQGRPVHVSESSHQTVDVQVIAP